MHSTVTNRGGDNDVGEDRLDRRDVRFQMKMARDDLLDDNDVERILSRPSLSRRKLEIYEAPEFVRRLSNYQEAFVGEAVTFTAQYRALPKPTVKWFKDEEEVNETKRYNIDLSSEAEGIVRLIIQELIGKDEGAYKCKVENQEGVASTTGYLSVLVKSSDKGWGQTSPTRKPAQDRVSSIPFLRPIIEQRSMEETEEQEYQRLPPSPLQEFMDRIRHGAKSMHGPIFYADIADVYADGEDSIKDFDSETTGDEEDVFDEDTTDPSVSSSPADDDGLHLEVSFKVTPTGGSVRTDIQDVDRYPSPAADSKQVTTTSQVAGEDSAYDGDQGSLAQVVQSGREGAESGRRQRRLKLTLQRSQALELPDSDAATGAKFPHDDNDGQTTRDRAQHASLSGSLSEQKPESLGTEVCRKSGLSFDVVAELIDSRWAQYFTGFIMSSVTIALVADISPAWLVVIVFLLSLISFVALERHLAKEENT